MEVPVQLNNSWRAASVRFAGPQDFAFVGEWQKSLGADKNPIRVDAVDFARIAAHRFEAHSEMEYYAESVEDIADHIQGNPKCEVACCVLLTCDWFPPSNVIGLAHFRRTWSNNIVLDYLTTHPFIAKAPNESAHVVKGAGLALLYFLSTVARKYACPLIWGEATPHSCGYYKKVFNLPSVEDLISIPRDNFMVFISRFDKTSVEKGTGKVAASTELEEVYALEAKDSPFVGSKTAVFNPRRRLANRFLELPYHSQVAVATALGLLQEEDKKESPNEVFRRLFQRASDAGRLSDLWREVEKQYPDGEPEKSPFPGA
jgi:hypothetical protein